MKKKDYILIILIFALAVALFFCFPKAPADLAVITVDGEHYATVSLLEDKEIKIGNSNIAEVSAGTIFMKSATCPDKLCIHQGAIFDSSKKIVCLPNKVIIEATNKSSIDTVVK